MNQNRIKIYWNLALEHPLFFFNAYLSAVITSYLLALQPKFLKVFINEATRGVLDSHLFYIAIFMLASLFLAFLFDTIQVTTSMVFRVAIEKKLRMLHYKYSKNRDLKDASFPIQRGIFGLTEFTLMTSLELMVSLTNIAIVLYFIFTSSQMIGVVVLLMVISLISVTFPLIKKIGNISKKKEEIKSMLLSSFNHPDENVYEDLLNKIEYLENIRFRMETVLVFSKFFIFKVSPTLIIFYYIFTNTKDFGELASMFLYFAILHQPITKLIGIIKQSVSFFSQAEIFKDEIEDAIIIEKKLLDIPYGLVCIEASLDSIRCSRIEQLRELSKKSVQIYFSSSKEEINKSDFVLTRDFQLMTTAKFIWNQK